MANQQTKANIKAARKEGKHFHGDICNTGFEKKSGANKRKSAWRGVPEARRKD